MLQIETRPSPLLEAEKARQVVGVLTWIERRFEAGAWARGARFGSDGSVCLIGGIDEATGWTVPGVADEVTSRLVARVPHRALRAIGRVRPRLALALYNDVIGGRAGAYELVRTTRADLGGLGPAVAADAAVAAQAASSAADHDQLLAHRDRDRLQA